MSQSEAVTNAKPFNPDKQYSEVHAHKVYSFLQNGIYYDHQGNPVAEQPKPPTVRQGVKRLRQQGPQAKANLDLEGMEAIGAVPQSVADVRKENAQAAAAEDLLA